MTTIFRIADRRELFRQLLVPTLDVYVPDMPGEPRWWSDVLRFMILRDHPWWLYVDCDVDFLKENIEHLCSSRKPAFPRYAGWVDVWACYGAGDELFFDRMLRETRKREIGWPITEYLMHKQNEYETLPRCRLLRHAGEKY